MPSINLDNLERYDSKARNEAEEEYMPKDSGNWQKTEKAGAVSFYPVENSPLEGTVDFMFTEVPPASGDKSPTNPSTIAGAENVKVSLVEKNILELPYYSGSSYSYSGINISVDANGELTINGVASSNVYFHLLGGNKPNTVSVPQGLYTIIAPKKSGVQVYFSIDDDSVFYYASNGINVNVPVSESTFGHVYIRINQDTQFNNYKILPVVYYSNIDEQNDYIIPLGSTYYGGSINLATGLMTVTWKGYVFDGTENWLANETHGTYYRYSLPITPNKNTTDIACTHFMRINNLDYEYQHYIIFASGISIFTTQTTVEDFKAWLASQYAGGTPVVACYALATPYTVQLSPTSISALAQTDKCIPRLNTVYTDADTIQIGYMKSPQRTEQEITQAILEIESDDSD